MSVSFQELIVWSSPAAFGLALYLAHDAFTTLKTDVKELKDEGADTSKGLAVLRSSVATIADSMRENKASVDAIVETVKKLDHRSGDTREMCVYIKTIENKLSRHESDYGKVLLILQKVVANLKANNQQDPK